MHFLLQILQTKIDQLRTAKPFKSCNSFPGKAGSVKSVFSAFVFSLSFL